MESHRAHVVCANCSYVNEPASRACEGCGVVFRGYAPIEEKPPALDAQRKRPAIRKILLGIVVLISVLGIVVLKLILLSRDREEPHPARIPLFVYDYGDRLSGGPATEPDKSDIEAADIMRDYLEKHTLSIGGSRFWYDEQKGVYIEAKEKARILVTRPKITDADRLNDSWSGYVEFRAAAYRWLYKSGNGWGDWQSFSLYGEFFEQSKSRLLGEPIELQKTHGKWGTISNENFRKPRPDEIPK